MTENIVCLSLFCIKLNAAFKLLLRQLRAMVWVDVYFNSEIEPIHLANLQ